MRRFRTAVLLVALAGAGLASGCDIAGAPIGSFDTISVSAGGIVTVQGWTFDPDIASAAIQFEVVSDLVAVTAPALANGTRTDVGAAYPGAGNFHGFSTSVKLAKGTHDVCVRALNIYGSNGINGDLGCKKITITESDPIGALDAITTGPGSVTVAGWALDPDTSAPISVRVYDGANVIATAPATSIRTDVGAAYPANGSAHGYNATVAVPVGAHVICVAAIDATNPIVATTLGCRVVTA